MYPSDFSLLFALPCSWQQIHINKRPDNVNGFDPKNTSMTLWIFWEFQIKKRGLFLPCSPPDRIVHRFDVCVNCFFKLFLKRDIF